MTDIDFQKVFVQELYKRGYDRSNISEELRKNDPAMNASTRIDIVIHYGNVILQAFELKHSGSNIANLKCQARLYRQKFGRININAPIYCVIFDDEGNFEIFDENFIKQEIDKVLNFESYLNRIDKELEKTLVKEIPPTLKCICYISSAILMIYQVMSIIYSCYYCCCGYSGVCNRLLSPSIINLFEFIIAAFFALLPSILKLQPKLLIFQFGLLKVTMALSSEYKPK